MAYKGIAKAKNLKGLFFAIPDHNKGNFMQNYTQTQLKAVDIASLFLPVISQVFKLNGNDKDVRHLEKSPALARMLAKALVEYENKRLLVKRKKSAKGTKYRLIFNGVESKWRGPECSDALLRALEDLGRQGRYLCYVTCGIRKTWMEHMELWRVRNMLAASLEDGTTYNVMPPIDVLDI